MTTRMRCALAALVAGAIAAPALAQTVVPGGANGAMTFPNVRVVNAPNAYPVSEAAPGGSAGWRAYVDDETGLLAEPSPEAIAALERALPPDSRKPSRKALQSVRLQGGGSGLRLDAQTMSYSIVRRMDDGRLVEACVPGEELAEKLVRFGRGPIAAVGEVAR